MKYRYKFDYDCFYSEEDEYIAVSKERYTKEEAIKIIEGEIERKVIAENLLDLFVRNGYGYDEINNEPCHGCWLEEESGKGRCPVWAYKY